MDPAKALALLAKHQQEKAIETATAPPQDKDPNEPTGQVIELGAPSLPPPPPVAAPSVAGAEALASSADGDVDVSACSTPDLHARLQKLQTDRVVTYRAFDDALDACRADNGVVDVAAYAAVVQKITKIFELISKRFNACEAALRSRSLGAAADCCRRVQNNEKDKLELTAAKHMGEFRPDTDDAKKHLEARLREVVANINEALEELRCELDGEA